MFELRSHRVVSIPTVKNSIAIVLTMAIAGLVTVCFTSGAGAERRADLSKGRALAKKLCARCHAINLDDSSKLLIAPPFRTLAARYSVWGLQEALAEGIVVGHPEMPKFVLTPEEIFYLLSYMETLAPAKRRKDQGRVTPGQVK